MIRKTCDAACRPLLGRVARRDHPTPSAAVFIRRLHPQGEF